jgi:hypothetical protein
MSKIDKIIKQKLLALPEYLDSPPMFGEVRITRYLVLCVILYRSLLPNIGYSRKALCALSKISTFLLQ